MSGRLNLSAWALAHRTLVLFLIMASIAAGIFAYSALGRAEDPSFTFKVMTIRAEWPGATAAEVERHVTDPIEEVLEEVPHFDYARSYSRPGESVVFVTLRDDTPPHLVQDLWYQTRKKVGDMAGRLPDGVLGPWFDDEFGDVYSAIYAFAGEEFSPAELKAAAEAARERLRRLPGVEQIDLIADRGERVFVEISSRRLASFGVPVQAVVDALRRENAMAPSGRVETDSRRVFVRLDTGEAGRDAVERLQALPITAGDRVLALGDVAQIRRGYEDPPRSTMRVDGRPAVGLGVVMAPGGDVLALGKALTAAMERVRAELPLGMEAVQVADQSRVVQDSVGEFTKALAEALGIVILVGIVSLGWRGGVVVALTVPLVLALTLAAMLLLGIDLHRISLGALIIALGLLVDDAIIAVEMMAVKMEQGWDRLRAGAFAYTSTAFPMLTGTLVTAAGFLPVGLARSASGEYTNAIFWVVGASLLISWVVAVVFTPYLGYLLLPAPKPGRHADPWDGRAYRMLRRAIGTCLRFRWTVIGLTAGCFVAALAGFGLVQQQFFPSASRPELLVDVRLAAGASFEATEREVERMERILAADDRIAHWVAYTGAGTPRFYLPIDQQLPNPGFAQFVVVTRGLKEREGVMADLSALAEAEFPAARLRVSRLENGPPVGYPVQFRVSGDDPGRLREIAHRVRDEMRADPDLTDVHLDWGELAPSVRLEVDPVKARALGIDRNELSSAVAMLLDGLAVTQLREGGETIDVVLRATEEERRDLSGLGTLSIGTADGTVLPLGQVAIPRYGLEEPVLWRRDRATTIAVKADVAGGVQAPSASRRLDARLDALRAGLPPGYAIAMGGAIEESARGQGSIAKILPLMVLVMVTMLMIQLQSFSRLALVLLTAPLGLIGVTASLLTSGLPFGFVALLGVIALAGIIMRNSVILVDQIDADIRAGEPRWTAVVDATVRRARPILLTAAAAILAMIPLAGSVFWGPMAVAIMGGLAGATVLTLFFLPALYAAWFRVRPDEVRAVEPAPTPLRALAAE